MRLTLVTGGARSGKSRYAEDLARQGSQPILYVATAEAFDDEMRARITEHRRRRPATWETLEARTDIGAALAARPVQPGTVLLEDLGLLVTNHLLDVCGDDEPNVERAGFVDALVDREIDGLLAAQSDGGWDAIVVTNEVGFGIVPATPLGRIFRDALGRANQRLAARADAATLLVAGLPLQLKSD